MRDIILEQRIYFYNKEIDQPWDVLAFVGFSS